jgi:hypothetical protein
MKELKENWAVTDLQYHCPEMESFHGACCKPKFERKKNEGKMSRGPIGHIAVGLYSQSFNRLV